MAFGPRVCACCGATDGVEAHHLYSRELGCPDDLTVWLCFSCHGRAHELKRRINISVRTKAALAQKKAVGALLGNHTNLREAQAEGAVANREAADRLAENVLPIVRQLQGVGVTSLLGLAKALNERGVRTMRGGSWHASSVRNLLARG